MLTQFLSICIWLVLLKLFAVLHSAVVNLPVIQERLCDGNSKLSGMNRVSLSRSLSTLNVPGPPGRWCSFLTVLLHKKLRVRRLACLQGYPWPRCCSWSLPPSDECRCVFMPSHATWADSLGWSGSPMSGEAGLSRPASESLLQGRRAVLRRGYWSSDHPAASSAPRTRPAVAETSYVTTP